MKEAGEMPKRWPPTFRVDALTLEEVLKEIEGTRNISIFHQVVYGGLDPLPNIPAIDIYNVLRKKELLGYLQVERNIPRIEDGFEERIYAYYNSGKAEKIFNQIREEYISRLEKKS